MTVRRTAAERLAVHDRKAAEPAKASGALAALPKTQQGHADKLLDAIHDRIEAVFARAGRGDDMRKPFDVTVVEYGQDQSGHDFTNPHAEALRLLMGKWETKASPAFKSAILDALREDGYDATVKRAGMDMAGLDLTLTLKYVG